eukprot:480370-Alexandrium_andersonii.AAC.1
MSGARSVIATYYQVNADVVRCVDWCMACVALRLVLTQLSCMTCVLEAARSSSSIERIHGVKCTVGCGVEPSLP